jgi:hypothetical protein
MAVQSAKNILFSIDGIMKRARSSKSMTRLRIGEAKIPWLTQGSSATTWIFQQM